MVTQELVSYVRAELGKGKTRADIQKELFLVGGWQARDVDEVFKAIDGVAMPRSTKSSTHAGFKVFALVVFAIIAGYIGWWIRDREMFFRFNLPLPGNTSVEDQTTTAQSADENTPSQGIAPIGQTTTTNNPNGPDYTPSAVSSSAALPYYTDEHIKGVITKLDNGCQTDGACRIELDNKVWVAYYPGRTISQEPIGTVTGDLKIGATATVFAKRVSETEYTIVGNTTYSITITQKK